MSTPTGRDAEQFRKSARERAFAALVRIRLYFFPGPAALALIIAWLDPTPWRRVDLIGVVAVMIPLSLIELVRYRRHGVRALMVPYNLLATAFAHMAIMLGTGGLFSPALPGLMGVGLVGALVAERRLALAVALGLQVPFLWALAFMHASSTPVDSLIPSVFGAAPELEHGPAPWLFAFVLTAIVLLSQILARRVSLLFTELHSEAMLEKDRSLEMHAEQSRALTTLSAEVAHELKNPLASIKGLASLVAKDLDAGKSRERMEVLRGEVDRMQGILEEFLNFSRPLVPLAMENVSLGTLVREVVDLHEASTHGVLLTADVAREVRLPCDPRKVRQVLINLVQNAIDASEPGQRVEVVVEAGEGTARVRVLDRGDGLDGTLGERVFEAGVTTKHDGSGLGLTMARSLARQHGGELVLRARIGGGCEAELTLPLEAS